MLENLIQLIKENAGEAIINNPAIPNVHNDAAIETAASSLFNALQGTVKNNGLNNIKDLFQTGQDVAANPLVKNLSSNVAGDLMKKFNLNQGSANNIVSMLIPVVMSKLVKKTNDPGDNSFNLDGIIGALTGGQGKMGGLLGTLKGLIKK